MEKALEGLRVVDLSHYLAGPAVAMVLADLGADAVRIDPPTGPRWDHPANAMLQRGKRSIALDFLDEKEREIARRLVRRADVVIENFRPGVAERLGVGPRWALEANPRLVYCSMPGFGEDDPRAAVAAWEGVVCAAAGIYVSRTVDPKGRPAFNAVPYASSFGAAVAAHGVIGALIARERTGLGQRVEAPLFDALFEAIGHFGIRAIGGAQGMTPNVFGAIAGTSPHGGFYRCADDRWLHLCLIQWRHLEWFAERFFPQEWVDDGMVDPKRMGGVDADPEILHSNNDLHQRARKRLEELLATKPAADWERIINEEIRAPSAACLTTDEWLNDDEHARESGAVISLSDPVLGPTPQAGYPFGMSLTAPAAQGPRHEFDVDRESILEELEELELQPPPAPPGGDGVQLRGALDGIRVVDVAQVLAGPTSTRILGEYGADVIKVMSPYDGQVLSHTYTNSGKRSIMLDLGTERGKEIYLALTRDADVVQENFSLGTAERMGIGEPQVRAENSNVVYSWISSYGAPGPRAKWRGREELGQAVTGMQLRWGGEEGPRMQPYALNDYASGNWAAVAIMAALFHRFRDGQGQRVQSSLAHAATYHQLPFMISTPELVRNEPSGPQATGWGSLDRLYRASDGWMYVAVGGEIPRERMGALGEFGDVDFDDAEALEELFATDTAANWVALLREAGVGAHVLADLEGTMEDETTQALGLSYEASVPGIGPTRLVGPSRRLRLTPVRHGDPPNPPGVDGREVLGELGLDGEFDDLAARKILYPELPDDVIMVGRFRAAV